MIQKQRNLDFFFFFSRKWKPSRGRNFTTYYVNTKVDNQIPLNDKPSEHVSLVKKVRDKIKQEASTRIASTAAAVAAVRTSLLALVSVALIGLY